MRHEAGRFPLLTHVAQTLTQVRTTARCREVDAITRRLNRSPATTHESLAEALARQRQRQAPEVQPAP